MIEKQVGKEGRTVDPLSWRRMIDKRACESMLGGQTRCQTHRHQTHEAQEEEDEGEPVLMGGEEFTESTLGRVQLL